MDSDTCNRVIRVIDADVIPADPLDASAMTRQLLAWFPNLKPHAVELYTLEMVKVFAAYPRSVGAKVLDPVNGAMAQSKFMPSVPDVNRALIGEVERRQRIKANARGHIIEASRRNAERLEKARADDWEKHRPDAETRARQAAEVVQKFRAMN